MARDDLISTLMFDISNLTIGKKETKVFTLNPEVKATRKCIKTPVVISMHFGLGMICGQLY